LTICFSRYFSLNFFFN